MSDDLRSVPGVGPATAKKLIEAGIKTPAQLIEAGEVGAIAAGISKATAAKIVSGASTLSGAVKQVASKAKDAAESTASKDVAESTASKAKDVGVDRIQGQGRGRVDRIQGQGIQSQGQIRHEAHHRGSEGPHLAWPQSEGDPPAQSFEGMTQSRNALECMLSRAAAEVRTTDQSRGTTHEGSMQRGVVRASIARFQITSGSRCGPIVHGQGPSTSSAVTGNPTLEQKTAGRLMFEQ